MEEERSFEKVAQAIADRMNHVWEDLIENLARGDLSALNGSGRSLSKEELREFFNLMKGAHLGVEFEPRDSKLKQTRSGTVPVASDGNFMLGRTYRY